ncbi:MAG: LysR family transcriptional regulator [Pseudomonadota bacterium]
MDTLDALRAFHRVVSEKGFAAAARELGLSRSVVNKQVRQLERRLGTQLFQRSTRRVVPTDAGRRFYEQTRPILMELETAFSALTDEREQPSGTLRVNAPMTFGARSVAPIVADFLDRFPDLRIELVLNDRAVDPIEEGFDVTLRIGEAQHFTSLIVEPLATVPLRLCASPAYLTAAGIPDTPTALREHRCLHYGYQESGSQWRLTGPDGTRAYAIGCVLWSNNGEALRDAGLRDQGILMLPGFLVDDDIAVGRLVPILDAFEPQILTLSAVYPRHRLLSRKVQLFVDTLRDTLADPVETSGKP